MAFNKKLLNSIQETVELFYESGGKLEINYSLPYISIEFPNGDEYYFQDLEAENLLLDVPDELSDEEYLIWVSREW